MTYYTCGIISVAIIFLHIDTIFTDTQSCFDSMYNEVLKNNNVTNPIPGSQVLIPKMSFSCGGTIINLLINLTKYENKDECEKNGANNDDECEDDDDGDIKDEDEKTDSDKKRETDTFPIIQIWRNLNSSYYLEIFSYVLCAKDINDGGNSANVSITSEPIAFQAGDFIGYYIPTDSAYSIHNVFTMGNTSYSIRIDEPLSNFTDNIVTNSSMVPVIQIEVESFASSISSSAMKSTIPFTTVIASTTTATIAIAIATATAVSTNANAYTMHMPVKSLDASIDGGIGSNSSSSSVTGIVIGCVVGLVICIILMMLIVILIWHKKKKVIIGKRVHSTAAHLNNLQPKCSSDDKEFNDHQYSSVNYAAVLNAEKGCFATIKNMSTYDVINEHIHINHDTDDDLKSQLQGKEPIPYSEPINSTDTVKKSSKYKSTDDYESLPVLKNLVHNYEIVEAPYQILQDPKEIPTPTYENKLAVGDRVSNNEQIYEDPGHKKEVIYSWFEKKKFRKIKKEDIRLLHQIGSGEFGVVNLGLWSNGSTDPVQVAVKALNSQCSESDRVKFLREAAIMGQFVHNNVVQLHGVVTEENNVMILLEYMPKGDLEEILIDLGTTISQETLCDVKCNLLMFGSQVAAGMNYLASKQFVHRDLAARNILVSSDDVCKIADFGMARDVADDTYYITSGGKIPLKWTAPEAIYYKKYSAQSDVWSFGCVLYEIWSLGHKPFEDIDGTEYVEKITTGYRLPPPPGCPRAIYELMIQCWHPVAKHRPLPDSVSQTLQKSQNGLLTSPATDDAEQLMMLGEPLSTGNQLYLDLQQTYLTNISN